MRLSKKRDKIPFFKHEEKIDLNRLANAIFKYDHYPDRLIYQNQILMEIDQIRNKRIQKYERATLKQDEMGYIGGFTEKLISDYDVMITNFGNNLTEYYQSNHLVFNPLKELFKIVFGFSKLEESKFMDLDKAHSLIYNSFSIIRKKTIENIENHYNYIVKELLTKINEPENYFDVPFANKKWGIRYYLKD